MSTMKTKTITQTATFNATPQTVYEALLDSKKHAAFTGANAKIDKKVNGKFNVHDGYCHGYNIEFVKNEKKKELDSLQMQVNNE